MERGCLLQILIVAVRHMWPILYDTLKLRHYLAYTQEVALLKGLSYDRNIVQFYGVCPQPDGNAPLLVLEYMAGKPVSSQSLGSATCMC